MIRKFEFLADSIFQSLFSISPPPLSISFLNLSSSPLNLSCPPYSSPAPFYPLLWSILPPPSLPSLHCWLILINLQFKFPCFSPIQPIPSGTIGETSRFRYIEPTQCTERNCLLWQTRLVKPIELQLWITCTKPNKPQYW